MKREIKVIYLVLFLGNFLFIHLRAMEEELKKLASQLITLKENVGDLHHKTIELSNKLSDEYIINDKKMQGLQGKLKELKKALQKTNSDDEKKEVKEPSSEGSAGGGFIESLESYPQNPEPIKQLIAALKANKVSFENSEAARDECLKQKQDIFKLLGTLKKNSKWKKEEDDEFSSLISQGPIEYEAEFNINNKEHEGFGANCGKEEVGEFSTDEKRIEAWLNPEYTKTLIGSTGYFEGSKKKGTAHYMFNSYYLAVILMLKKPTYVCRLIGIEKQWGVLRQIIGFLNYFLKKNVGYVNLMSKFWDKYKAEQLTPFTHQTLIKELLASSDDFENCKMLLTAGIMLAADYNEPSFLKWAFGVIQFYGGQHYKKEIDGKEAEIDLAPMGRLCAYQLTKVIDNLPNNESLDEKLDALEEMGRKYGKEAEAEKLQASLGFEIKDLENKKLPYAYKAIKDEKLFNTIPGQEINHNILKLIAIKRLEPLFDYIQKNALGQVRDEIKRAVINYAGNRDSKGVGDNKLLNALQDKIQSTKNSKVLGLYDLAYKLVVMDEIMNDLGTMKEWEASESGPVFIFEDKVIEKIKDGAKEMTKEYITKKDLDDKRFNFDIGTHRTPLKAIFKPFIENFRQLKEEGNINAAYSKFEELIDNDNADAVIFVWAITSMDLDLWGVITELNDFLNIIFTNELIEEKQILNDLLPSITYQEGSLLIAYLLLKNGYAEPSFLRWAFGICQFYGGSRNNFALKIYNAIPLCRYCAYQLAQVIINLSINDNLETTLQGIDSMGRLYGNKEEAKNLVTNGLKIKGLSGTIHYLEIVKGYNNNTEKHKKKSYETFLYDTFPGWDIRDNILKLVGLKSLQSILKERERTLLQKQAKARAEAETKLPKEELKDEKKKEEAKPEVKKIEEEKKDLVAEQLNLIYTIVGEEKLEAQAQKAAKENSRAKLEYLPRFKKISEIKKDQDVILESNKIINYLISQFAYMIKNHESMKKDFKNQYKELLGYCNTILITILSSPSTLENIVKAINNENTKSSLETLASFAAFLISLPKQDFNAGVEKLTWQKLRKIFDEKSNQAKSYMHRSANLFKYYFFAFISPSIIDDGEKTTLAKEMKRLSSEIKMGNKKSLIAAANVIMPQ